MPYIEKPTRDYYAQEGLDKLLETVRSRAFSCGSAVVDPKVYGELNYVITKLCLVLKPTNYSEMQAIKGLLDEVKDEFRRKVIVPYEASKAAANGEVYP